MTRSWNFREKVVEFGRSGNCCGLVVFGRVMFNDFEILDISQSVSEETACFPGDVSFSKAITLTYEQSNVVNLTAITMSPHVGTHADAPSHICGDLNDRSQMAGALPLIPYVGECVVLNLAPMKGGAITKELVDKSCTASGIKTLPPRVLFRTQEKIDESLFKDDYPYIGVDAVSYLSEQGVKLVGIDTPSVDHINSKTLDTHHALSKHQFCWLENLHLESITAGRYFLVAAPLKLLTAEAAPVRAILLRTPSRP